MADIVPGKKVEDPALDAIYKLKDPKFSVIVAVYVGLCTVVNKPFVYNVF